MLDIKKMNEEGYVFVTARAMAAAALFTSKDKYRPVLEYVHVVTRDNKVMAEGTDAYRILRATSRAHHKEGPKPCDFLVSPKVLKQCGILSTRPKACAWLAMRPIEGMVHVIAFEEGKAERVTHNTEVPMGSGSYPDFDVFFKLNYKKSDEQAPYLNTSYLIETLKAMEMAVSHEGMSTTGFRHGSVLEPMYFTSSNTCESCEAIVMPVRK